jgi:catechol 2,3-dioxygenase-like lactoylglutathione lyase family enzyme
MAIAEEVPDEQIEFIGFTKVRLAVTDLEAAIRDWVTVLGWPMIGQDGTAVFALDSGCIELHPVAPSDDVARVEVEVAVADVAVARQVITAQGAVLPSGGRDIVRVDKAITNGVALRLVPSSDLADRTEPGQDSPYRRISHVVVAVQDAATALDQWRSLVGEWPAKALDSHEVAHHVPVGAAWFGITESGTDDAALQRFVARYGEGVYALGLLVDDRSDLIRRIRSGGGKIIDAPSGQIFLHPATTHGLLIELNQVSGDHGASRVEREHS